MSDNELPPYDNLRHLISGPVDQEDTYFIRLPRNVIDPVYLDLRPLEVKFLGGVENPIPGSVKMDGRRVMFKAKFWEKSESEERNNLVPVFDVHQITVEYPRNLSLSKFLIGNDGSGLANVYIETAGPMGTDELAGDW